MLFTNDKLIWLWYYWNIGMHNFQKWLIKTEVPDCYYAFVVEWAQFGELRLWSIFFCVSCRAAFLPISSWSSVAVFHSLVSLDRNDAYANTQIRKLYGIACWASSVRNFSSDFTSKRSITMGKYKGGRALSSFLSMKFSLNYRIKP